MAKVPWWVWASVVACAAASLVSLSSRHRVETSNRAVGIMMSMEDVEVIAATSQLPTSTVIKELQERGLTGIAFKDETVGDLIDRGEARLDIVQSVDLIGKLIEWQEFKLSVSTPSVVLDSNSDLRSPDNLANDRLDRIGKALDGYVDFPLIRTTGVLDWKVWDKDADLGFEQSERSRSLSRRFSVDKRYRSVFRDVPVGIDSRYSRVVDELGLTVIARLRNSSHADNTNLARSIRDAAQSGASAYLIGGDQAIGNRELIETTRDSLVENGMQYISPEFVTLGGDSYLRRELADRTLRLHSISAIEAEKMSASTLNERFAKAFRERGARWLLLRPTTKASDDPLKQIGETLVSLRSAIRSAGGEVKEPRPFEDPNVPIWLIGLIGVLALPAIAWAALTACGSGPLGWSVTGLYVAVAATTFLFDDAHKLALLIAVAFPVVGYLIVSSFDKTVPIRDFILFTATSMVGGLAVGGILTGVDFMVRADQFTGVKLAIFAPIIIVGILLLRKHGTIKELMSKPVTWGTAAVAIGGLVAMFMLAARSGNENPAAVSGFELQIRSLLDQLLFVRPRTKEVILGHPALVLGLMMMVHRPNFKGWAALLLFVGMVGQTSVVNTFCHLHTPIALSLARVGVGVLCGGIIGLILWHAAKRWIPSTEPAG